VSGWAFQVCFPVDPAVNARSINQSNATIIIIDIIMIGVVIVNVDSIVINIIATFIIIVVIIHIANAIVFDVIIIHLIIDINTVTTDSSISIAIGVLVSIAIINIITTLTS
jgi:hypothetical protein